MDDLIDSFDRAHDHRLSTAELRDLLAANGFKLDKAAVETMFGGIDDEHDGFDEDELSRVLNAISGLPSVSERVEKVARATRWVSFDVTLWVVAGLGFAYTVRELDTLERKWAASNFRSAVQLIRMETKYKSLDSQLAELQAEKRDVEQEIDKAKSNDPSDKSAEVKELQERLMGIESQLESTRQARDVEIDKLQERVERSMREADAAKTRSMEHLQTAMRCVGAFYGQGRQQFEKAQQGFCDSPSFSVSTVTFGTFERGQMMLYEASKKDCIGEGRDCAYRAREVMTDKKFALKVYDIANPKQKAAIHNDLNSYSSKAVDHRSIVRYERVIETKTQIYVLMELIDGKDLFDVLALEDKPLTEDHSRPLFQELTEALAHLHQHHVVHCDVKPENAMIIGNARAGDANLKLIDFGFSHFREASPDGKTKKVSFDPFVAPEYIETQCLEPHAALDMWRLGLTLYKMLLWKEPFSKHVGQEFDLRNRKQGKFHKGPEYDALSAEAKDLICKLVEPDPAKRLPAEEVLAHHWVRGAKFGA